MKTLKSIGVLSVFKMSLVLGATAGLLVGIILGVSSFIRKEWLEGLLTLVLAPLLYGGMGAVMNSLMAWVYNAVAARLGGVELEIE